MWRDSVPHLQIIISSRDVWDFPGSSNGKESACNAGGWGSIPRSGRSPGEGKGYPLQYSCLENSMDRGAWRPTVHGVTKSRTQLSTFTYTHICISESLCCVSETK